ncbi:MAG: DUF2339 domain-containing protein [Phycisphaerae bacterium]|nr:DUF2339 domain-containing protein [Phycisphaerae bacterium]
MGSIVVVLAMSFFVKLAYDQGWFGLISPTARCLLTAAFGVLLIALGEVALRMVGRPAAVGLFGGGLGTLYLTAYATFRYFELVSEQGAFVLLAVVAALGIAITVRGRMLTIGVLSLLGGYLCPVLLRPETQFPASLPLYATMLLTVGLVLSAWNAKPFRALRYVALAGHGLIATAWIITNGAEHWLLALALLGTSCYLVVGEAFLAARRAQSPLGNCGAALAATAWFVTLGCWLLNDVQPGERDWLGLFTAAIAIVALALAYVFGSGLTVLRKMPRTALDKFTVTLWAIVGVLLAVAIALQFDGYGQTVGWLALGLASIELGRRLPSRGVSTFGLVVLGLAAVRVVSFDYRAEILRVEVWSYAGVQVTRWVLLALGAIFTAQVAAQRVRTKSRSTAEPTALCLLATAGWLVLWLVQGTGLTITALWLLGGIILLSLERIGRRQHYLEAALVVLCATAGRWLIADAVLARLKPDFDGSALTPFINWQMGLALAIAATGWWAFRVLIRRARGTAHRAVALGTAHRAVAPGTAHRAVAHGDTSLRLPAESQGWQWAVIATATFLLVAFSFQIDLAVTHLAAAGQTLGHAADHLRQLLFTLLWTLGALGVGILATATATRDERGPATGVHVLLRFAWGVLLACAIKWVAFDAMVLDLRSEFLSITGVRPLLNVQLLVGIALASGALLLVRITGLTRVPATQSESDVWVRCARWVPVAASLLLLWGLSFETLRTIHGFEAGRLHNWTTLWHPLQLRGLWLTLLWAGGGLAMTLYGRFRPWRTMFTTGSCVLVAAGLAWLTFDTLFWRLEAGVVLARPILNLQFVLGLCIAGITTAAAWLTRRAQRNTITTDDFSARAATMAVIVITAIGLWLGSLEIDRICAPEAARFANAAMVRQTVLSIYWGLFGIGLVTLGFVLRIAWFRYVGLALLAVTLAKVLLFDLAAVRYLYRVLSLLATGLLCMATSVAYAKLSSRLLARPSGSA